MKELPKHIQPAQKQDQIQQNQNQSALQQNADEQEQIQAQGQGDNYRQIQLEEKIGQDIQQFKNRQSNRGVCFLSRIPPYMKPNYIRKLLKGYLVERIYLLPESEWIRKNRIKRGGNKKICFREGWIQFADKRMAKLAALTLNSQKMVPKKGNFYSQDIWNLKYLPNFKWHHLTERLAHQQRLKKQRLKVQLQQQRKIDQFYSDKISKSKTINGIVAAKKKKGTFQKSNNNNRQYKQIKLAEQINDQ